MAKTRKTKQKKDEKTRDTSPTVFSAAGLIAFAEEDAVFNIKPIHVIIATTAFIATIIVFHIL